MLRSDYLETPQGQIALYNWRKFRGMSYYSFDNEPKSKTAMKLPEKIKFQKNILEQMKESKKLSYRSDIVADISISSAAKNPPHIHTATKNLLDLFSKPIKESGINRKGLIYQDDRQISYLCVRYFIGSEKPEICACFAPFRNFIYDLVLYRQIPDDQLREVERDLEFQREIEDDDWDNYKDLKKEKSKYVRLLGAECYDSMLKLTRVGLQESFLRQTKLHVRDVYLLYEALDILPRFGEFNVSNIGDCVRSAIGPVTKWITDSPLKVGLPQVPTRERETERFKEQIRDSFILYKERFKILDPLYQPVCLEVLYKPPTVSGGFFKDLDNIMKMIIPIFHEEFRPPAKFMSGLDLEDIQDDRLRKTIKQRISSVPKSVPYSIQGYEILEVPRHKNETGEGFISLGLTLAHQSLNSIWDELKQIIERWGEDIE